MKIGLIAGSGALPHLVVEAAKKSSRDVFVVALKGFADPKDFPEISKAFSIAEFGKITRAFRKNNCTHVCFAGNVNRPDFRSLRPDFKGFLKLPGAARAAKDGDDSLLKFVVQVYESDGFEIISPQDICTDLLLPSGHLGAVKMSKIHRNDVEKACKIASAIGGLDIGQGAVVCRGLVLAVEAQEGTDAMLSRVALLPADLRGHAGAREGVLAKMVKPGQETRVDLPTIGLKTIALADEAGLAGIALEAEQAFVIDREAVIAAANAAGIFIAGIPPLEA